MLRAAVPETTVDEDRCPSPGKDQVRSDSTQSELDAVAVSAPPQRSPQSQLRFGVGAPDARHLLGSREGSLLLRPALVRRCPENALDLPNLSLHPVQPFKNPPSASPLFCIGSMREGQADATSIRIQNRSW